MKQMSTTLCIIGEMLLCSNVQADLNNGLSAIFNDGLNDDLAVFTSFKRKELN